MLRFTLRLLAPVLLIAGMLAAQSDRGMIAGTVRDAAGAVIPGARITATHVGTNVTFKAGTTEAGEFTLPSLPVGAYRVVVENDGFKSAVHDKVELVAGNTVRLDTKLEVGSVHQSVEVAAQGVTLQTDDAKLQNEISNKLIESLPTVVSGNMRSPFDLAALTPGANGGDQDFRVGGGQQGSWAVTLDGTSANTNRGGSTLWAAVNAPALEAITEFRVETNGFKAEFGRAGGGVVSFISKSGTNEYHGTLFDFVRNNAFDARGFFNATVPIYRQNDFGATVGGPVRIPKLYNGKNKTFFFFSYEGFRNRVGGSTSPIAIPPPEVYQGDFTNYVSRNKDVDGNYIHYTVYDPSTTTYDASINNYVRTPFPNNRVPVARFDPLSVKVLDIAKTTLVGHRKDVVPGTPQYWLENYYQSGTSVNPNDKYSVKFDHVLSERDRLSTYIGYNKRQTVPGPTGATGIPGILNQFNTVSDKSNVYRGSWDHTFGARMHNRFYFGINTFVDSNLPLSWGEGWKAKGICMKNVPNCDINLPMIGTGDFGTWGGYGYNGSENPTWSFNDDISLNIGKHFFKAGYQWEYTPYNAIGQQNVSGGASFGSNSTALPNTNYTGSGFASFLLGVANGGNVTTPRFVGMQWKYQAMYFQDDWRVLNNLTLNLGLRYEFNLPTTNSGDQCADFDPTLANPGATGRLGALVFCGTGPGRIGRSTIPPGWYKGFGPRLSFSWNPGKFVVRGGVGITYAPVKTLGGSAHFQGFAQILSFPDQTGGITPVFQLSEGLPAYAIPPFLDPTFSNNGGVDWWQGQEANRLPEPITWNLTLQRELGRGFLVEAGYSAQAGTHLVSNETDYNRINIDTLPASLNIFTAAGRNLLTTAFNNKNQAIQLAGFGLPYPQFPQTSTLAQAMRPFPQYTSVATSSGGDHSGHSAYHSLVTKVTRRYAAGLVVDASYVISKLLTDAESSWGNNSSAMNHFNRRLDKALSGSDRTHDIKLNYVYELPIGPGKRWLRRGFVSQAIGGWRIGSTHRYASGTPLGLGGAFGFPGNTISNRAYVTTFEGWRAPLKGEKFDPALDRFYLPNTLANWTNDTPTITSQGWFPLQPRDRVGNMTRNNPKVRNFPLYSENVSLAKTFTFAETRTVDLRFEAFNVLNRTQFGSPNTNLGDTSNFGVVNSQANTPRRMQFALKVNW